MFIDICVQDPLNEGAWWHSACDTATSHLWVSQRLRLHRRGLDNMQKNHFDRRVLPQMVYVAVAMLATNTIASLGVIVVRCVHNLIFSQMDLSHAPEGPLRNNSF